MSDIGIRVDNLSKIYRIGAEEQRRDWTTAAAAVLVLLVAGAFHFRRTERTIVDMI